MNDSAIGRDQTNAVTNGCSNLDRIGKEGFHWVARRCNSSPRLLTALLAHLKAGHEAENQFHRDAIESLRLVFG
jgi:hypothetical protein